MKVMLWVTESNLELLNKGEIIQYWLREPGDALDVVQVQISYDEFIRLRDNQPDHYVAKEHIRYLQTHYMDDVPIKNDEGYGVED